MSYFELEYSNIINEGTEEELHYKGYCNSISRKCLYYFIAVISLGTSLLFFNWKPALKIKFQKKLCEPSKANTLILYNKYNECFVAPIIKKTVSYSFPKEFAFSATASSGYGSFQNHYENGNDFSNEGLIFKYFIHHHVKYVWDQRKRKFCKLRGYDSNVLCKDILEQFHGLYEDEVTEKLLLYGENTIDIEVKSYVKLFFEEVMHPFYVFQIFSIILWFVDNYIYFSSCILLITSISMAVSLYEIRKQSQTLHNMVSTVNDVQSIVIRNDSDPRDIPSSQLVPGDVIVIPPNGCIMSCDAVLTAGSCIVNESMLTGESVPIMKTQLPLQDDQENYNPDVHKRHTLFCGTEIIQTRYYGNNNVTAVVIRTGFSTAKGELVRSILFPRPLGFKFYQDSMRFVGILFILALAGICYALYIYIKGDFPVGKMIIRVLDIVTVVVPPSLPAAMTVGSVYAQNRLKKQGIFCISPPRINVCGRLKLFCFDKTGTLTEEGLDLWAIQPVEEQKFIPLVSDPKLMDPKLPLVAAMATCHSLTMIDGVLKGDPLDLKMFESINWILEEPGEDHSRFDTLCPTIVYPARSELSDPSVSDEQMPYEIGIVRQFTFSSTLQRMSVIARSLHKQNMDVYVKGAPEKIISLCYPNTVPENFSTQLQSLTVQGYRVIALAWRSLDSKITWHHVQRIKRDEIEKDLSFLGLIVLQNMLKPETTPVIHILNYAKIRTVMATGDNMHTAISVARKCGMIGVNEKIIIVTAHSPDSNSPAYLKMEFAENNEEALRSEVCELSINDDVNFEIEPEPFSYHFCMNGKTFSLICHYFPELVYKFVLYGTVFARMSPDQKTQIVKILQEMGYIVGMCGDGANDCGALKTADVGISLSEAEASVAAPFTSKIPNIQCVPTVIKEGRCALVTSFGVFKYMALYSIIQFISVLIMYTYKTNLGDQQFLYIDLGLATIMAIVMSYTKAYANLVPERPPGRLVSFSVIFSVISQILLAGGIQVGAIVFLKAQPWYVPTSPDYKDVFETCWEASVIFAVSNFQYIITATVFSKGPPFRKPFYTNGWMVSSLIFFTLMNLIFLLHPFNWLAEFFQLSVDEEEAQFTFRLWLLGYPFMNLVFSVAIEIISNSTAIKAISKSLSKGTKGSLHHKTLEAQMASDISWPRVNQIIYSTSSS